MKKLFSILSVCLLCLSACNSSSKTQTYEAEYDYGIDGHVVSTFLVDEDDEVQKHTYYINLNVLDNESYTFYIERNANIKKAFKKHEGIKITTSEDKDKMQSSLTMEIDLDDISDEDLESVRNYMDLSGLNYSSFKEIKTIMETLGYKIQKKK